ncbi:MAG: HTH-type transcriptional regulator PuuR [Firmicutes bacterium ADurb.Bin356]|nr:MAG: HTH-type transcriptional regulator PuuR [Firmicutes bacterium ADurb.Bin356]
MIRYSSKMAEEIVENMRGGKGKIGMTPLFETKIPHLRLLSKITLEPGSSIGSHQHHDEAEVYFVLEGEAAVLDNGEEYILKPGDAHLCSSGGEHALLNKSASLTRILAIIPTLAE